MTTHTLPSFARGPKGEQGIPGPAGSDTVERVADVALGAHRIVRSTGATGVQYASPGDSADTVVGMTLSAPASGASVVVQRAGPVEFAGWSWVKDDPVFVGAEGVPTQTMPAAGMVKVIGFAQSSTSIFLQPHPAFFLEV